MYIALIFCNIKAYDLYIALDIYNKKIYPCASIEEYKNNHSLITRKIECEFLAIHKPCQKGLTEEEYIIKEIIE